MVASALALSPALTLPDEAKDLFAGLQVMLVVREDAEEPETPARWLAEQRGARARRAGLSLESNPFARGAAWVWWRRGWVGAGSEIGDWRFETGSMQPAECVIQLESSPWELSGIPGALPAALRPPVDDEGRAL